MLNQFNASNRSGRSSYAPLDLTSSWSQPPHLQTTDAASGNYSQPSTDPPIDRLPAIEALELTPQKPHSPSLRRRLLQTVVPTVLLPLAVVNAVVYKIAQQRAETRAVQQLKDQALLASEGTANVLEKAVQAPETIATNPLVISAARTGSQRVQQDRLDQASLQQLEQQFNATKVLQPDSLLNGYLSRVGKTVGIAELIVTEKHGLNVAFSRSPSDFAQQDEDWWQKGKALKQWIAEPEMDASANTFSVAVSQAIVDPASQEFLGVIKAVLPTEQFAQIVSYVQRTGMAASQSVQLLSADTGSLITTIRANGASSRSEITGGQAIKESAGILSQSLRESLTPEQITSKLTAKHSLQDLTIAPLQQNNADRALVVSFVYEGKPYALTTVPKTNWVAVATIDRSDVAASANDLLLASTLTFLVLGVAAVVVILYLSRQLSAPLRHLSLTAEQVAAGNLDATALPGGTQETQTLARTLNNLTSQTKRFFQEQAIAVEQARLLAQINSSRMLSESAIEGVFDQAIDEARQILAVDRMVIYRFNPDWSGYISNESVVPGWPQALYEQIKDPCIPQGLLESYRWGRVVPTTDVFKAGFHPEHLELMKHLKIRANLVVPILHEGQLFGLLIAHHCAKVHDWRQAEIGFMQQLAAQLGVTLDRVRFVRERELQAERSQFLRDATLHMAQASSSEELLDKLPLNQLRQILQVDRVLIYRFDENWQGTITAESVDRRFPQALGAQIHDPCFAQSYVEKYRRGRVQATPNIYEAGLTDCYLNQLEPFEVKANLVAPILQGKQLLGLLIAHQCSGPRHWEQADVDLFTQVSNQIGLALDRCNLLAQKQVMAEQASLLRDITLQITQTETSDDLLTTLPLLQMRQALEADRVLIYRFDEHWQGTIIAESVDERFPRALGAHIYDPCFAKTYVSKYKQGRIQATTNIYDAGLTECHLNQLEPFAVKANLVAPILQGKQLLGLLIAHQCSGPRQWQQADIALFAQVSNQVGLALDRCNLLAQKQAAAEQARLLQEITQQVTQAENPQAILTMLPLPKVRQALEADRVLIYRFDEHWQGTIIAESVDERFPRALGAQIYDPCFAETYVSKYRQGRVHATANIYDAGLTECHLSQLEAFAVKANLVAPILQANQLIGLLIAHQCSGTRKWEPQEINFFAQVAVQIGLGFNRVDLLEQKEAAAQQARLLAEEQSQQREQLQQQLIHLQSQVEEAAMGNLTVRADVTEGEIGTVADFFNSIVESLRQIVVDVQQSTIQVNEALGDNETDIRQLAAIALKQAEDTTHALHSVEQMTHSIQAVAQSAGEAAKIASAASSSAEAGGAAMELTVRNIQSLRQTIGDTAKKMKRLGESSQQISKVVSLIEKIALQTNLLAVNAGIEAARAGEEGQGFAVVAEEVGVLAAQSANATREVEQIVRAIQSETSQVVEAMEHSIVQVVEGTQLVEDAKCNLQQILNVSHQIDQLVKSISQATVSQTETSQTITQLMQDMAQVSEQTSSSSMKVSSSLQQTVAIAQQLQASVETFSVEKEVEKA